MARITRFRDFETISGRVGQEGRVGVSRDWLANGSIHTRKGLYSIGIYERPAGLFQQAFVQFETGCATRSLEAAGIEPASRDASV